MNLLVGRNNSGKTKFLEALEMLLAHGDLRAVWDSLSRRGERITVEEDQGEGALSVTFRIFFTAMSRRSDRASRSSPRTTATHKDSPDASGNSTRKTKNKDACSTLIPAPVP